jgi:hypothetical protein
VNSGLPRDMVRFYTSLSAESTSPLLALPGDGAPRHFSFTNLIFRDHNGDIRDVYQPDEPIQAVVQLTTSVHVQNVVIGLDLRTLQGTPVCNLRSEDAGLLLDFPPGTHEITISFALKRFLTNSFLVDLGAMKSGVELLAHIPNARMLSLATGDISGHGRTRQNGDLLYVPSSWQVREATSAQSGII